MEQDKTNSLIFQAVTKRSKVGTRRAYMQVPRLQAGRHITGERHMNTMFLKLIVKIQDLMSREEGQDLVEYALLLALVASAIVAAGSKLTNGITAAFTNISTTLGS